MKDSLIHWGMICQEIVDREGLGSRLIAKNYNYEKPALRDNDPMLVWIWTALEDRNDPPYAAIPPRAWARARRDLGLTAEEMAEMYGMDPGFIEGTEDGTVYVPALRARLYDMIIDDLPAESDAMIPSFYITTLIKDSFQKKESESMSYSKELRRLRKEEWKISQTALATVTGYKQEYISRVERGEAPNSEEISAEIIQKVKDIRSGKRSLKEVHEDAFEQHKQKAALSVSSALGGKIPKADSSGHGFLELSDKATKALESLISVKRNLTKRLAEIEKNIQDILKGDTEERKRGKDPAPELLDRVPHQLKVAEKTSVELAPEPVEVQCPGKAKKTPAAEKTPGKNDGPVSILGFLDS